MNLLVRRHFFIFFFIIFFMTTELKSGHVQSYDVTTTVCVLVFIRCIFVIFKVATLYSSRLLLDCTLRKGYSKGTVSVPVLVTGVSGTLDHIPFVPRVVCIVYPLKCMSALLYLKGHCDSFVCL